VVSVLLGALLCGIVVQRLIELRLAKRNEAWARARGAVERGARHYPAFFFLHTAWLLAWPAEAWLRGPRFGPGWWALLGAFAAAQLLRYWAIRSLGPRWNTRILVLPGRTPIEEGPYRLLRHPNYLAVCIELAVVPLAFGAWWTAAVASVLNAGLLLGVRIPAEARALAWADEATRTRGPAGERNPR
jgi:methyltransferase